MKLPTKLGRLLLEDIVTARVETGGQNPTPVQVIAAFQRMALVADFDVALQTVTHYFKPDKKIVDLNSPDGKALKVCFDLTKKDVLGHAIEAMTAYMDASTGAVKDKITAAMMVNELFGDKELIKDNNLTDRLMINLVGKEAS